VTVDERTRMRLNGESSACMAHIRAIKKAGGVSLDEADGDDTSKDQTWHFDHSCMAKFRDMYVICTSLLWLLPKALVFFIPALLLQIPTMLVLGCYRCLLKECTETVERTTGFWISFCLATVLYVPMIILAILMLLLDYIFYWIFGVLFCAMTCRWMDVWRSMRAIDPYRNGPWVMLHLPDVYVALIGQTCRHGMFQMGCQLAAMWYFIPWVKYYVNCNPWIYKLEHRMVTQISTEMKEVQPAQHCVQIGRDIISRAKQMTGRVKRVDMWWFVPHYPYPPPGKRYALGMQVAGTSLSFSLIVHTTHALRSDGGCREQLVLSNSCKVPVYRVMLWYNNPFHFLTGYVEANISNGGKSQPEKDTGGEHPMWLVTSRTPLTAGRKYLGLGSGFVDKFFDFWFPVFVHEVRYSHHRSIGESHEKALEIANSRYQQVVSEDGVSKAKEEIGLSQYGHESALEQFGLVNSDEAPTTPAQQAEVAEQARAEQDAPLPGTIEESPESPGA